METITELKGDLSELEKILSSVSRSNVRQVIVQSISNIKKQIEDLEEKNKRKEQVEPKEIKATSKPVYTTKITSYGWDESKKFVKIYVTIKNAELIKEEQLNFERSERSMKLTVTNHMDRNHTLSFQTLAFEIKPSESTCKVKAGNIVITLCKAEEGKTWGNLTESQRKEKEAKDSKLSDNSDMSDPSAGIMNMMKKMYDDGDDDMKRMIKKTWYETQQKQQGGGMPEL